MLQSVNLFLCQEFRNLIYENSTLIIKHNKEKEIAEILLESFFKGKYFFEFKTLTEKKIKQIESEYSKKVETVINKIKLLDSKKYVNKDSDLEAVIKRLDLCYRNTSINLDKYQTLFNKWEQEEC